MPIFPIVPVSDTDLSKLRERLLSALAALLGRSTDTERIVHTVDKGLKGIIAVGKDFADAEYMKAIARLMEAEALLMTAQAEMTKAQAEARKADAEFIKAEAMRDYLHAKTQHEYSSARWAEAETQRAKAIHELIRLLRETLKGQVSNFASDVEQPMLRLLPPKKVEAS